MMSQKVHLNKAIFLSILFVFGLAYCYGQKEVLYYPEKPVIDNEDSLKFYLKKNLYKIDSNASAIKIWEFGDFAVQQSLESTLVIDIQIKTILKFCRHDAVQYFSLDYLPMDISSLPLNINGTVYNLEKDSIKKESFSFSEAELEKENKYIKVPELKEGSIVDLTLTSTIRVPANQVSVLPTWFFDGDYPTLFSAYFANFPTNYSYRNIMASSVPFKEVKTDSALSSGDATFIRGAINGVISPLTVETWERKNIPAFQKEIHMPSPELYRDRVTIQFSQININKRKTHKLIDNWNQVSIDMYNKYPQIKSIFKTNRFLEKTLENITQKDSLEIQKAQSIYTFVRDSFTKTEVGYFSRTGSKFHLKKLLESRNGSMEEINLLLSAMLEKAGLQSNLVMVSTKPNAPLNPEFPNITKINSLICYVKINNKVYFLDASDKNLPFGLLNPEYYNGYSRILSKEPFAVDISADSVVSHTIIFASIKPDSASRNLKLKLDEKLDNFNALTIRKAAQGKRHKAEELLKANYNGSNFEISQVKIENLDNPDLPLRITYFANLPIPENQSRIYLPLYFDKISETNPFPDEQRKYPVDMGGLSFYSYYLQFTYPESYTISVIPKPIKLMLANNNAIFTTTVSNNNLQHLLTARANFHTTSATFATSNYEALRSLWATMLTLTNQNIVLEKENSKD